MPNQKFFSWIMVPFFVLSLITVLVIISEKLLSNFTGFGSFLIWIWLLLFIAFLVVFILSLFRISFDLTMFLFKSVFIWSLTGFTLFILLVSFYIVGSSIPNSNSTVQRATQNPKPSFSNDSQSSPKQSSVDVLPKETFTSGLGDWYEEIWYAKKDSGGEVTTGLDGITFKGIQSNSRGGVMLDINSDVSVFKSLTLSAIVTANTQTLSGTGWNGREAPVAIAISYQDESGADHKLLGDDPKAAGQMFWRGFYYMDPTDKNAGIANGIKVKQGVPYNFTFDLMNLNPKPKKIYFIAIEGAGWKERLGKLSEIVLIGTK